MQHKKFFLTLVLTALVAMLAVGAVFAADDGPWFHRNVSSTPHTMTGASQLSTMWLYVPAQNPLGELSLGVDDDLGIEYLAGDCSLQNPQDCVEAYVREEVKPLISTYNDGIVEEFEDDEGVVIDTGAGFGERDGFAALSLDDGATWKRYNLSNSADISSFLPTLPGINQGIPYPGDVFKIVHAVEGNMVAVAWISRYCEGGAPLYSWEEEDQLLLASTYAESAAPLGSNLTIDSIEYNTYTSDLFGVAGGQKSVDYTAQDFAEVGEVPYGCVWVARGTLEQVDAEGNLSIESGMYDIKWRASERLTSGVRDPHQINITSSPGAGFIISWQEDPEGLRPGKGMGPGEGWSGAIANAKTDIWYTYLDLTHFTDVCTDDETNTTAVCTAGTLAEADLTIKPKAAVPFAMPMRLTDNNMCQAGFLPDAAGYQPYCYADFDGNGTADLCADSVSWTNPGGSTKSLCVTEDGRTLAGRTANTRVRWAMKSFDSDSNDVPDSAWVLLGTEKGKALGIVMEYEDGSECPPLADGSYPTECIPVDIGKNMWYHTFEFDKPELVAQGLMLNAPATVPFSDPEAFFDIEVDEWGNEFYDTEIARRFNLFVNSPAGAMASESKTAGMLIYKQGILFQGGPADVFLRRMVLPEDFDPATMNPFDYENVQCVEFADDGTPTEVERLYADGSNPNYLKGLCPVNGMNITASSIVECTEFSTDTEGGTCAEEFPFSLTYEEWADPDTSIPKVLEWVQAPDNFNDHIWENPYDVSKGHRGFIDGDYIMMMYASAANWKANTTGNEAYQLYIRRSFDGGQTWTTMPASFAHIDGVIYEGSGATSCEWYGGYGVDDYPVCLDYAAGAFEQARNVSQLAGTKVTVLDPRYTPTGGMLKRDYTSLLCYDETADPNADGETEGGWVNCEYTLAEAEAIDDGAAPYPEDIRDPSAFFATFETGDNTVVTVETGASPLDMYYSKASNFGDDWDQQDICALADTEESWYPNAQVACTASAEEGDEDPEDVVELRWDWLENGDDWATEASVYGNPNGDRFYAVWNQELPVDVENEIFTNMDTEYRRIFYNLNYVDTTPTGEIVYVSSYIVSLDVDDPASTLLLIGDAWDNDRIDGDPYEDIAFVEWSLDGTSILVDDTAPYRLKVCAAEDAESNCDFNGMTAGWHQFSFSAKDKGGKWSPGHEVTLYVSADALHRVYLPLSR